MSSKYDDILHLPHHVSTKHPRMCAADRAAQFSPFAALSGHDAAINETARLTCEKIELAEDRREELNRKLQVLADWLPEPVTVTVTYFLPDTRKQGGAYVTVTGQLKKFDCLRGIMVLADRTEIPIHDITDITSPILK